MSEVKINKMLIVDRTLGRLKVWRLVRGGLWIKFTTGEWSRCKWIEYSDHDGYIQNPFGGSFHRKFKEIVKIEEYPYGERFVDPDEDGVSKADFRRATIARTERLRSINKRRVDENSSNAKKVK